MALFGKFKEIRKTSNMVHAERVAGQQEEGTDALLLVLIEEVRQLRKDFAEDREERADRRDRR